MIFRQLFDKDSSTYTYLLADEGTKKALLIDPVIEHVERDYTLLKELGVELEYCVNTHVHADHITGSGKMKNYFPNSKSVLGEAGNEAAVADIKVKDKEVISLGDEVNLEVRHTPGHTAGCITLVDNKHKRAFTGDTLLIRGCGRTDFQQGSSEAIYESIHGEILSLPEEYMLFPGHDYKGRCATSVKEEQIHNPRTTLPLNEFEQLMKDLNLPYPRKIDASLPANLKDGLIDEEEKAS